MAGHAIAPVRAPMRAPVLTQDQLRDIAQTVLRLSTADTIRIQIRHTAHAVTRIANNRVLTSDNGDQLEMSVENGVGGRVPIRMESNQIDDTALRAAIASLDALAKVQVGSPNNYLRVPDGPQQYVPVTLWHDATAAAMATVGDTVVPQLIQAVTEANLRGAGFVGLMARSTLVLQKDGLEAYTQETDSECTVSARTRDGTSSGWSGRAHRDWSTIQPEQIVAPAIDMAKRGANPVAVEPGRRTAILSPCAIAQVMRHVSRQFDAYYTNVLKATAFAVRGNPDRENKIGLRVFDPRIAISSDPADLDGGFVPFGDCVYDGVSLPMKKMSWVERGILKTLAYNVYYGLDQGQPFSQNPWSMRMALEPGNETKTIEEMIQSCEEGIYVHRLSNVDELSPITGMQTGVTRDGCFLIKHGKIDRPIKNFRFTDSPFLFLNNVIAMGTPERVAMGFVPPVGGEPGYATEWPRRPLIMPPVMIRDFNFTALSDAV